ncbi:NUDIX hydrolase [Candidatus Vecturithrix granuli]|uniref:NUDIX hydrolase n=1 Tax=Vecturithrix granuli TaxID=1499967 RepID=A0A081BWT1_VECG1|nr:NUDIX hydrolase [Candidatus Vecturithrix granuli]
MTYTIQEVHSAQDIDHIRNLFREYANWLSVDLSFQGFEQELATLPGVYTRPDGLLLLAYSEGKPAGCIALRKIDQGIGEVKRMYVVPACRRQGLARQLLECVIEKARIAGYSCLRLDTLASMIAARQLYASFGFREIPPYYHNPLEGAVYMELELSEQARILKNIPPWLVWAREIQALSQTGLTYCLSEYDRERYQRLGEIAAEIVEQHTRLKTEQILENFALQPGYATPKVDVRGAVIRDGKILLIQERSDQRWSMPGGWADVGDFPSEVAVREVWEESGFQVVVHKLLAVFDCNRAGTPLSFYHAYKLIFLCEITGGEARTSHETLDVGFFAFDNLPPLSQQRTNQRHLQEIQAHLQDQFRSTAYD